MHECLVALGVSAYGPTCCEPMRVRYVTRPDRPRLLRLDETERCEAAREAYHCAERLGVRGAQPGGDAHMATATAHTAQRASGNGSACPDWNPFAG